MCKRTFKVDLDLGKIYWCCLVMVQEVNTYYVRKQNLQEMIRYVTYLPLATSGSFSWKGIVVGGGVGGIGCYACHW